MKPPDDKMPDEMRKRVMEQMPWLKNPNNTIPIVTRQFDVFQLVKMIQKESEA